MVFLYISIKHIWNASFYLLTKQHIQSKEKKNKDLMELFQNLFITRFQLGEVLIPYGIGLFS